MNTARPGLCAAVCLAIAMSSAFPAALGAEIQDHPLVSRYEGSIPSRQDEKEFAEFSLITGIAADGLAFEGRDLAGRVTRTNYQSPDNRSPLEILENYQQAITGAGGELLFACRGKECGPPWAGSRWGRFNDTIHLSGIGGYVAGRIVSGSDTAYVAVAVAKRRHQVTVIEVGEMETGLVKIDPEALGEELDRLGHVAVPGVYFETGKAVLTPESGEALRAMTTILESRPGLFVWVVGHTDWTGGLELNARLSTDRARAVVRALTGDHGIAAGRVEGHGVGPLAPAAANASESGRAANRRVELVARPRP